MPPAAGSLWRGVRASSGSPETARGSWPERVEGIDAGADDYLPKPFHMEELVARARSLVRRAAGHGSSTLSAGALSIDVNRMTATLRGVPLTLSPLEYRLLAYLTLQRDRVVPTTEILEHLHGDDDAREANALEALITRLRRKLGGGVIGTRRGFGYFACQLELMTESADVAPTLVSTEVVTRRKWWPVVGQRLPARIAKSQPSRMDVNWDALAR